jgi:hypothetical protein
MHGDACFSRASFLDLFFLIFRNRCASGMGEALPAHFKKESLYDLTF